MSKGLGARQTEIKEALEFLWSKNHLLRFAEILMYVSTLHEDEGPLPPEFERSLRRSLAALIKRGDVLIVFGNGTHKNPHQYMRVEDFAALNEKPRDLAHAKRIAAGAGSFVPMMYCLARAEADHRRSRRAARRQAAAT